MGMYGWDPANDNGPKVDVDAIAGELTGADLWEALSWNTMLSSELEALFLVSVNTHQPVAIGLQFIALAKAAQRLAVEKRAA
jgi:hypothetical protein